MQKYITILFVATFLAACGTDPGEQNTSAESTKETPVEVKVELTAEQAKIAGIKVGEPELRDVNSQLRVNGVVEAPPENVLSVTFPLGGYVRTTKLIPGMEVKKGALLATIEDTQLIQLQQDYLMSKSSLEFASADYSRQETLNKSKSISDKVFQQARAEFQSQKILVKSLSEKLRLVGINPTKLDESNISRTINIYSPINAYVSKVNVNPGKYVTATDILFELIDPSDAHVSLTVFEKDASSLKVGQKVTCFSPDKPDEKFSATVYLITPNINEDRSVEVHCHLYEHGRNLKPGTFINAEIQSGNAKTTAVPDEAIVRWQNKYYVFIETSPNGYEMKQVETGSSAGGFTAIRTDLGRSKVVFENAYTLLMKLKNSAEEE